MIGSMAMPANFEYADVFAKGQPKHQVYDPFWMAHPPMDRSHRAKLFNTFDALDGFDEAISAKEILYEFRRELSDEERDELNRRINILSALTKNSKQARKNKIPITVTCYVPCMDKENFSFGYRGQYIRYSGICRGLGIRSIRVNDTIIPIADLISIESEMCVNGRNIFAIDWETEAT